MNPNTERQLDELHDFIALALDAAEAPTPHLPEAVAYLSDALRCAESIISERPA